jgi:hypothetical protein
MMRPNNIPVKKIILPIVAMLKIVIKSFAAGLADLKLRCGIAVKLINLQAKINKNKSFHILNTPEN